MKIFSAFILVCCFLAWPFLIQWLDEKHFYGADVLIIAACYLYLVQIVWTICCYAKKLGDLK